MTKLVAALSILLVLVACASTPIGTTHEVSLASLEGLVLGKTTKASVSAQFGQPSSKRVFKGMEVWDFDDPRTGGQLFTTKFNSDGLLISKMWLPRMEDPERNLDIVLSRYSNVSLKPVRTENEFHSIDTQTTYSDAQSMSILVSDRDKKVEAMSWFLPLGQKRTPSDSE